VDLLSAALKNDLRNYTNAKSSDYEPDGLTMRSFKIGDSVRITRGPFTSFVGVVEKVSTTGLALVVTVDVFGRRVPVAVSSRSVKKAPADDVQKRPEMNLN
jgi:transcription antitermination factor NusG